jgi:hypothetical protein
MKELFFLTVFVAAFSINAFSQTGRIAHRSHSGKNGVSGIQGSDNFGLPDGENAKRAKKKADGEQNSKNKTVEKAATPASNTTKTKKPKSKPESQKAPSN